MFNPYTYFRTVRKIALVGLFAFITNVTNAQKMPFGEGVVDIYTYLFTPAKSIDSFYNPRPRNRAFFHSVFHIKGDHIFATVPDDSSTIHNNENKSNGVSTSLSVKIGHPDYLVYWNEQMAYYLFKGWDGKNCASPQPLKAAYYDQFYRYLAFFADSSIVINYDSTSTAIINDKYCYKGTFYNNFQSSGAFYYTKDSMSVKSPLNVYLKIDFPYNVMAIIYQIDADSTRTKKTTFLHQIGSIKECAVDASLTTLSDSTVIRKEENPIELMSGPKP